jgi:hypothetical protein
MIMPMIRYQNIRFREGTLQTIARANQIITDYAAQGFDLTLRQLFYQFVTRNWIANSEREYKKLGGVIADARLAGRVDWDAITDRTRYVRQNNHWGGPEDIVGACARQFQLDKWAGQPHYVETWIEKDALVGVIEGVCRDHDVPFYACRGYSSVSEIWEAGRNRFRHRAKAGKACTILYLGDHDPSGLDMTRDVRERVRLFAESDAVEVCRLALNMDQIQQYQPPPNPTKTTDSRSQGYVDQYGEQSWELDALDPPVIVGLIQAAILARRDQALWDHAVASEARHRADLTVVSHHWADAAAAATQSEEDDPWQPPEQGEEEEEEGEEDDDYDEEDEDG